MTTKPEMIFAPEGVCPLVPKGRGVSLKMQWEDGSVQYFPFVPWFEVEHSKGLGATLVSATDGDTVALYRQLEGTPDEVAVDTHKHDESDEQIIVVSGEIHFELLDVTVRAGENITIPKGQWHKPVFRRVNGRDARCVIVWRPALQSVNVQKTICGANREENYEDD